MKKFIKFCCVGLSNTVISLLIYYALKWVGINYLLAMATGYIISSVTGFLLNNNWVFKQTKKKQTIRRYYTLYVSALLLNLFLMNFQVETLEMSENVAPVFTIIITTIYNYFLSKIWVFNGQFKWQKIKQEIKENKKFYLLVAICSVFLIFLFINNLYNHPVADDFENYNALLNETSNGYITSIPHFLMTVAKRAITIYKTWQGTYFSNLLFSINPLLISENMYKFTMFLIQLFWLFSMFIFFHSLAYQKQDKKKYYTLFLIFTIFSILFSFSLGEGFYWFTGTIMYLIPFSMSLILLALITYFIKTDSKLLVMIITLLSILIGGTSYVTGLFVGFIYLCLTIYSFLKKEKNRYLFLTLLLIFAFSFALNVFCPGNFNRVDTESNVTIMKVIYISFVNAIEMIRYLLFQTTYIPFLLIAFPAIKKIVKNSNLKFEYPIILSILCLCCFICFFAPMSFSYKNYYQETRVKNIQLFYLVIMSTVCFINYYGTIYKKEKTTPKTNYVVIGIIGTIIMIGSITPKIQGFALIDDILYETSFKYDECIKEMNLALKEEKDKIKVKKCEVYPNTLHYYVIHNEGWINEAMSKYYDRKIIVDE